MSGVLGLGVLALERWCHRLDNHVAVKLKLAAQWTLAEPSRVECSDKLVKRLLGSD
jgi:hypothetical protein